MIISEQVCARTHEHVCVHAKVQGFGVTSYVHGCLSVCVCCMLCVCGACAPCALPHTFMIWVKVVPESSPAAG